MIPRDHQRAALAHRHVSAYLELPENDRQKYGSTCLKLPVLVHQAGLAQALHFVAARSHPEQRRILDHLAEQLAEAGLLRGKGAPALLARVREADFAETRRLTREVQRCLQWYKRLVQSELRIEHYEEDERDAG